MLFLASTQTGKRKQRDTDVPIGMEEFNLNEGAYNSPTNTPKESALSSSFPDKKRRTKEGKPVCPWTPTEDERLLTLLDDSYGRKKWSAVAKHLPGRKPMQCKQRHEALNPAYHLVRSLQKMAVDTNILGENYADIVRRRAEKPGCRLTALSMVQNAQSAIRYEIEHKQPYNIGGCCGRSSSYFQMLLGVLNVPQHCAVKRMNRTDMLEVLEAAEEAIAYQQEDNYKYSNSATPTEDHEQPR